MLSGTRITPDWIDRLESNEIFVFGSNLAGEHKGGAAKVAMEFGAHWGNPVGPQGQTYAIPTLYGNREQLPIETIDHFVKGFSDHALKHPTLKFLVTEIGCGIAGFEVEEMAPLFKGCMEIQNITLPKRFWDVLLNG